MKRVLMTCFFIIAASAVSSAQTFYFPQVAVGGYEAGYWQTTIFLSNAKPDTASGTVTFTKSDGSPFNSTWLDEAGNLISNGNVIAFQLGPNETRRLRSIADIPLATGYGTVTSNSLAVLGNAVFTNWDLAGNLVAEAGVPMAIPLPKQGIFIDTTSGFKTGVAIGNPNTAALHIHFEVVNDFGQIVATSLQDLPPGQHISRFVHEMFPDLPPMVGRLQFYCTNPMVSVGLRFDSSFVNFTTMPPIAVQP